MPAWLVWLAALWWGGITALAAAAVPMAFAHFGQPALAGPYAARLFQLVAWTSWVIAMTTLIWGAVQRQRASSGVSGRWALLPWLLLASVAAVCQETVVAERILTARATGGSLPLWHGLGTALVLVQWLCAARMLAASLSLVRDPQGAPIQRG